MYVFVLLCSVWDALTDNYISTWDGSTSEGLNGNLSDQEVQSLHIFLFNLHPGNVLWGCYRVTIISKVDFFFYFGKVNLHENYMLITTELILWSTVMLIYPFYAQMSTVVLKLRGLTQKRSSIYVYFYWLQMSM